MLPHLSADLAGSYHCKVSVSRYDRMLLARKMVSLLILKYPSLRVILARLGRWGVLCTLPHGYSSSRNWQLSGISTYIISLVLSACGGVRSSFPSIHPVIRRHSSHHPSPHPSRWQSSVLVFFKETEGLHNARRLQVPTRNEINK